ncbi:MAG: hypothetical protein ACI825_000766 [Planctomycetota bacterium]|jgi:uncharacterized protein GlcG (DUF336 family)
MNITLEQAEKVVDAAKAKAKEMDVKMNICVLDGGANSVVFVRKDDAR